MGGGGSTLKYGELLNNLRQVNPDEATWELVWTLPRGLEVYTEFLPDDIRRFKKENPRNLAILLNKVVDELRRVVIKGSLNTSADFRNALHCLRFITHVMSFIMEDQSDHFLESVFWRNEIPALPSSQSIAQPATPPSEGAAPEHEDEEIVVEETNESKQLTAADESDPLAIRLLNSIVNLLFYPNFTVSANWKQPETAPTTSLPLDRIWAPGIGVDEVLASSPTLDQNRCETLKCLLVLFSEALYRSQDEADKYVNKWLDIVACMPSYHSLGLFYSLINVSCSYDPIGWGVPYNHYLFNDYVEGLAETSLQVLCVLLNHNPSPFMPARDAPGGRAKNIFIEYVKAIQKAEDIQFIYGAMWQLLNNPLDALNTYLPNSTKMISCHQEMLMLFWKIIQENTFFFKYLLSKQDITKIVDPILHFLHEGRKDSSQSGLIHLGTFILLYMSGEREFGVQLNKPFTRTPSIQLPTFTGNYADYLLLVFHKLLTDGHERLDSLYECLLTIMANISPYIKSLSMITSVKLMNLFKLLSRPKFLFAAERNHRYVFFLLEFFNNAIQYQYEGNYRLIYAMIRDKEAFNELASLKLPDMSVPVSSELAATGEASKEGAEASTLMSEPSAEAPVVTPSQPEASPVATSSPTASVFTPEAITGKDKASLLVSDFVPSEEWLQSWRTQLPISTIIRLLAAVIPQIPTLITGSSADEAQICKYLKETTLVGLLPVPHPILIRRYQSNAATNMWFTTFMWGVIYLRNHNPPIFYSSHIKLFLVKLLDNEEKTVAV